MLIHTVSKLNKNSNLNFYLNILGEGPRRNFLEGLIVDLKQTKYVKLLGQLDRNNKFWNYFDKSDIFLLSSRSEGTPKVLLEAMARSLPVIATNVGGIPYMVKDGERGMLYEDDNIDQLCLNISTLLENSNIRNSIIKNAYKFSKNNTLEKSTKNMIHKLAKYFKWVE